MTKDKIPFPEVPEKLLTELEKLFPDTLPDTVPDQGAIGIRIGEQRVIRFLRKELTKQTKGALDGPV